MRGLGRFYSLWRVKRPNLSVAVLLLSLTCTAAPAAASATLRVPAGHGDTLLITPSPFQVALVAPGGTTIVATVPGRQGPPVRLPGIDGPQPLEPLGPAGGFPALGWVVGASEGITFPQPPFTGDRLFGAEAGTLVSIDHLLAATPIGDGYRLSLATDAPSLGPASLTITRRPTGGVRLILAPPAGLPEITSTLFTLASPAGEGLYGLGTRRDAFDQRGLLRNVWVEEQYFGQQQASTAGGIIDPTGATGQGYTFPNGAQAAFYVAPVLTGSRGWTAWVSQPQLQRLDLANSRSDAIRWAVAAGHLDLSLTGGGIERSVRDYTAASGRAPAPPGYVFAPWLDRINQKNEGEAAPNGGGFSGGSATKTDLQNALTQIRHDHLPIRTFGVEGWQTVPGASTFFPALRRAGDDLVAYWNPFFASSAPATAAAEAKHLLVDGPGGRPYPVVSNRGYADYVYDFTAPGAQAFWDAQLRRSCALGFEGLHADFGEFVVQGMTFADGSSPADMHNRYPLLYAAATRHAIDACSRRPFFYVRAGFGPIPGQAGTLAQTPAVIIGDESTDWSPASGIASVPPALLNLAIGGGDTFISDIGGYFDLYTPPTTAELFTRWSQLSALTPVMRIHDDTESGSRYPWSYDAATLDTYRRYARLHVRLRPLFVRWAALAARTGAIGPVRPLILDDPTPAARQVDDEWLLGRDLLAAPVIVQGATGRRVYLPAGGRWQQVTVREDGRLARLGTPTPGGRSVTAPAPLRDIAIYVRAGTDGGVRGLIPARRPRRARPRTADRGRRTTGSTTARRRRSRPRAGGG